MSTHGCQAIQEGTENPGYCENPADCEWKELQSEMIVTHQINAIKCVRDRLIKYIQLLESPIPAPPAPAAPPSQKASSDDILGTKRGTIDPLVSKQPEKKF